MFWVERNEHRGPPVAEAVLGFDVNLFKSQSPITVSSHGVYLSRNEMKASTYARGRWLKQPLAKLREIMAHLLVGLVDILYGDSEPAKASR